MPVNPFFNQTSYEGEQNLIQDLIDESIAIHGHETYYLKREDVDLDKLFGEDELQRFTQARSIEMYIKTSQSFQGQSEFVSKFGLHIEDQCTFSVSVRRFNTRVGDLLTRPREGDIVWLQMTPTNRYLFEIRFVEDKEQLFQMGKLYTYELRCEVMNYSHERVQTSVPDINKVAENAAYTLSLELQTGNGAYIVGETVYQGESFIEALATGTVSGFDANTNILLLQNITGEFANDVQIVGLSSNITRLPVGAPDTAPTRHDPIADNTLAVEESESIIVVRGTNPRQYS